MNAIVCHAAKDLRVEAQDKPARPAPANCASGSPAAVSAGRICTTTSTAELDLRGTFCFHPEFAQAVDLLNRLVIDVRPVISHSVPFSDAVKAFELAADKSQAMKVLLDFGVADINHR